MDPASVGLEDDDDVRACLAWLGTVSGDPKSFVDRLERAQAAYRSLTAAPATLGRDPSLEAIGNDIVAAYFAQGKSLLDDRRSFDFAHASNVVPWVKQLGANIGLVTAIPGAVDRAARMLHSTTALPDTAMFELVMASNYAADGLDVAFVPETAGQGKTPDFRLLIPDFKEPISVECKRLARGRYEIEEKERHRTLFLNAKQVILDRKLSVHVDVTYTQELSLVPEGYLANRLLRAVSSPIITPGGYPWKDEFGFGIVKPANVDAVRRDIRDSTLYFGTKLARLLSGRPVRENGYHLAARAEPDDRDPRFIDSISSGSVVTWQCIAPAAIERKARYVKAKLAEADAQLAAHGFGFAHLAMDMALQCESSDLRRQRNREAVTWFRPTAKLFAVYLHYLVPRISEGHTWLIDETVESFGQDDEPPPFQPIFPGSQPIDDGVPAWRQEI